ncbi:SRPBCC family protein [Actinoplanes sp. NPDC049802]|uniref:SRPBCC family protein n=1 Tax=Actinoplanes sp. NPDC049802 TaxID=3154742 RepID=UPI0033C289AC
MATVRVETVLSVPVQQVWEAVADVGAVHRRMLPRRVLTTRIDGAHRILTMPDGTEVRELIVAVDHELRRMAYTVVEGQRMPLTYHHASFQVFEDGAGSRLVWQTDVLPDAMAAHVRPRVEAGIREIRDVIEAAALTPRD